MGMVLGVVDQPVAGLREQLPGGVVLRVPDPGVEAGPDPAAGVQAVQRAPLRVLAQEVADFDRMLVAIQRIMGTT